MVFGPEDRDGGARLRLSKRIHELHPRQRSDGTLDEGWGHGSTAIGEHFQTAGVEAREVRVVQHLLEHRRHDQGPRDALPLHQLQPLRRLELALDDDGPAAVDRGQRGLQPRNVVQGKRQERHLLLVRVGWLDVGQHERGEAGVAEHDGLRPARRASGEQQDRGVLGVTFGEADFVLPARGQELFISGPIGDRRLADHDEPLDGRGLGPQRLHQRDVPLTGDEHLRSGVLQGEPHLLRALAKVQRHVDGVQTRRGEIGLEVLWRVHVDDRDAVSRRHARVRQSIRQAVRALRELRVGPTPVVEGDGHAVGHDRRRYRQQLMGMHSVRLTAAPAGPQGPAQRQA